MKKFLMMAVLAAFVVMYGVPAMADMEETVRGEVVSIDPGGKAVVIRTEEGTKRFIYQDTVKNITEITPGMEVEMTCIDVEGKACAKIIKPATPLKSTMMEGEIVSIDPGGKAVVIRTTKGEEVKMDVTTPKALVVKPAMEAETSEEMLETSTMPVEEMMPGTVVKVDCFDSGGKFCANKITVISPAEAGKPVMGEVVSGEIVSIDPGNKTVVINTEKGERSLYYQKVTSGMPFGEMEINKKVRAYCIDVEGKSCIKDIQEAE